MLYRRRWKAVSAFRQVDQNKSGTLDAEDAVHMLVNILPCHISLSQRCYLRYALHSALNKQCTGA